MNEDFYIALIKKDLLGTLKQEDRESLDQWLQQSDDNKLLANALYKAWEISDQYGDDIKIDTAADYKILQQKIKNQDSNDGVAYPLFWMGIAASLFIFAAIFFLNKPGGETIIFADADGKEVLLPDGSHVSLSQGTEMSYTPDYIDNRHISLNGSAYLKVVHDPSKPFEVHSPHMVTKVLGTSFLINDVELTNRASVQLLEGKVSVTNKATNTSETLIQNQRVEITSEAIRKFEQLKKIDFEWFVEPLVFEKVAFGKVVKTLESHFGVTIVTNEPLNDCSFSGNFNRQTIEEILESIVVLYGATLRLNNSAFEIIGGTCK